MKQLFILCILLVSVSFRLPESKRKDRVLIFSLTKGFHHQNIPDGIKAIRKLGAVHNFEADTTTDPGQFTDKILRRYQAIIFLSPTGEFFSDDQKAAFKKYIHQGGGFVGIHAATDCLYQWVWYGQMAGAYFSRHPKIQQASLQIIDTGHLATKHLQSPWLHTEEWYNFKYVNPDVKVLITVDEKSYSGGEMGNFHPISWYHSFEGGRVFYTALGHTSEDFNTDTIFLAHLMGGISYALGRTE